MLKPVRTVAPNETLIDLQDAIRHCRVGDDAQTAQTISALIQAATDYLDGWSGILGRALVTQTWRQDFTNFCDRNRLPLAPVQSVTSITYYDTDNAQQTLSTSIYQLLADDRGPYVSLKPLQVWPTIYPREDAISITYVAGYGTASQVPQSIKQAALLLVSHWNEHREAVGDEMFEIPMAVASLLAPVRRISF